MTDMSYHARYVHYNKGLMRKPKQCIQLDEEKIKAAFTSLNLYVQKERLEEKAECKCHEKESSKRPGK